MPKWEWVEIRMIPWEWEGKEGSHSRTPLATSIHCMQTPKKLRHCEEHNAYSCLVVYFMTFTREKTG